MKKYIHILLLDVIPRSQLHHSPIEPLELTFRIRVHQIGINKLSGTTNIVMVLLGSNSCTDFWLLGPIFKGSIENLFHKFNTSFFKYFLSRGAPYSCVAK